MLKKLGLIALVVGIAVAGVLYSADAIAAANGNLAIRTHSGAIVRAPEGASGNVWVRDPDAALGGSYTTLIGSTTTGLKSYEQTEVITTDTTLTASQSGSVIYFGTAGVDVTLPAPADGLHFRFVVSANFATTSMTIVTASSSNVIDGAVDVNSTLVACADEDTLTFVNTAELPGDWVELRSDGTGWYLSGQALTSGAITCTQAS